MCIQLYSFVLTAILYSSYVSIVFVLLSRERGPREMMLAIQDHIASCTQAEG